MNGVVCVQFGAAQRTPVKYRIYTADGVVPVPQNLAADIPGDATQWCSQKRLTWRLFKALFGVDLRSPSQWLSRLALTAGERHSIRIEEVLQHPATKAEYSVEATLIVKPYKVEPATAKVTRPCIGVHAMDYHFPGEIDSALSERNYCARLSLPEVKGNIVGVTQSDRTYRIDLDVGKTVVTEMAPERPEALGNSSFVATALFPGILGLGVILLFSAVILVRAVYYINVLAEPSNDAKHVFQRILKRRFGLYIIFAISGILGHKWPIPFLEQDREELVARHDALLKSVRATMAGKRGFESRKVAADLAADLDRFGTVSPGPV